MESSKLETESENDREASSCGSPTQNTAGPKENSSENGRDVTDGVGDDEPMNSSAQSSNNNSTTNNNNSGMAATFHGSRSASHIGRKPAFGQTCSMKTLLQDGILQTGEKVLTLEYDDTKFFGDLRKDGTIMMRGPDDNPHIYATPVAWANHCCKMLNPESKPLNAWSSIRFKGKRLDSYKLKWYRAQKNNKMNSNNNNNNNNVAGMNLIGSMGLNLQNSASLNSSIIRNLQQNFQQSMQNQQGSSRLMIHNPITNYFPQYENPIKNKKLIKSVLISNNMDNDCKRLVAKSLDLSVDPCQMSQQMNQLNESSNNFDNNNIEADDVNIGNNKNDTDTTNSNSSCSTLRTTVINYEELGTRGPHNTHDGNTMVKCIPFSAVDRIQPFNITVSTNALLLVDFHSHLVSGEVAGYLAGNWDPTQHVLTITQAFPCRVYPGDQESAENTEDDIRSDIEKRNLTLVGWYHSHQGKYSNHPTIKDIQNQMEHQITMKESASGYTPCVGLICSPHDTRTDDDLSPSFQIYWVMPPPEHMSNHYGRPMQMYYSVTRDLFLTQDLLLEMRLLASYYNGAPDIGLVDFKSPYRYNDRITNLDKLSGSIKPKLPKDLQESEYPDERAIWEAAVDHFWKFLKNLVVLPPESSSSNNGKKAESLQQDDDQQDAEVSEQQPEDEALPTDETDQADIDSEEGPLTINEAQ